MTVVHQNSGSSDADQQFLQIRPELVRRVRGGNAALVYSLIEFRCRVAGGDRVEDADGRWWRATFSTLSEETGLTVDQVRSALKALQSDGTVEAQKHRVSGPSDQKMSYRAEPLPAIRSIPQMHSGDSPNGRATVREISRIDSVDIPNHHSVDIPNVSLPLKNEKEGRGRLVSRPAAAGDHQPEEPPPRTCFKHPNGTEGNCGACGSARKLREAWDAGAAEREAAERQRQRTVILNCPLCDPSGWRVEPPEIVDFGLSVIRCDHTPWGIERWGLAIKRHQENS